MPLLGFTKLLDKLLDGTKTQTIRRPRKHPMRKGDTVYIYWKLRTKQCKKLGEGVVTKIVRKQFCEIDETDAVLDGFDSLHAFLYVFEKMHNPRHDTLFDLITWKWTMKVGEGGV